MVHLPAIVKDEMGNLWVGESGHRNEKVYNMMKCFIIFFYNIIGVMPGERESCHCL
jgi:hypothetical protein